VFVIGEIKTSFIGMEVIMLSNASRLLTYLTAILYTVLGALLFFLPEQLAPVFAWKVTPFMTMTIGGWCLGNAWLAWITARRWQWNLVFSALLYLWLFGVSELLVLFFFRSKLVLAHPIAWLYFVTLIVNAITALVGVFDWFRLRPSATASGSSFTTFQNVLLVAFILFVGLLGVYGSMAQVGAPGTNGGIFPEVMSPFTLRSFGVFYLSIALSVAPFLWNKNINAILNHSIASYGLIFFITSAAFVYLRLFDFAAKPGGLLYFGAYLIVGIPLLFVFRTRGTGKIN
jgi:hypothetical protein